MDARLTTELIPRTAHGISLRSAGTKAQWSTIKSLTLARANHRCEVCGTAATERHPLETHEAWEWVEAASVQRLIKGVGLVALCRSCHHAKHPAMAEKLGLTATTYRHLMNVNGWTREQLDAHIKDSWRTWLRLSRIKWVLEVDFEAIVAELKATQPVQATAAT